MGACKRAAGDTDEPYGWLSKALPLAVPFEAETAVEECVGGDYPW